MTNVGRAYKNWPKYDDDLVNKAYVDEATKNIEISEDLEKQVSKNSQDIQTANSDIVNLRNEKLDSNVYNEFIAEEYNPLVTQVNTTVKQVDVEYYLSDKSTELIGGTWSTDAPPWEDGKYMWSRQKVTYVDGTYITRNATCISGAQGTKGEDAILLQIESSNGNIFKNTGVATTLTVSIIVGEKLLDSSTKLKNHFGNDAYLQWQYKKFNEIEFTDLSRDDPRLSDEGFIFTLNANDVLTKTVYNCNLII